jgi:hypothetical protein
MVVLLVISIGANILFIVANGRFDSFNDEEVTFRVYFRWPF